jgi:ribosomal 30S subunit maturation factor RimM
MGTIPQDLVGRDVYARDGDKVGQIRELVYGGEYVVVRRSLFSKIVVPVGVLHDPDGRLTIPFTSSYLDNAPRVDPKYELSPKDKAYLDSFYMPKAA